MKFRWCRDSYSLFWIPRLRPAKTLSTVKVHRDRKSETWSITGRSPILAGKKTAWKFQEESTNCVLKQRSWVIFLFAGKMDEDDKWMLGLWSRSHIKLWCNGSDQCMHACMHAWMHEWMNEWTNERMNERTNEQMNEWRRCELGT